WVGTLAACDGSGIALLNATPTVAATPTGPSGASGSNVTGATSSAVSAAITNVLGLRCEGLGSAVDNTQVRLQPDGLHVDAENVADADFVVLEPEDGSGTGVEDFERANMPLVFDVDPGTYWLGCRV